MGSDRVERRSCGRCGRKLPRADFARYGEGNQSYCRSCQREYDAAWYQANKARRKTKVRADRAAHIAWLDSLKEGMPCADCWLIAKCELVCANCHRERTFGSRGRKAA